MKILRLDLIAFGPFTGAALDLGEGDEGLHIVYGHNEAGKSSALRALSQMLYGIPVRSPDDFIHPYPKLRIGAVLRRSDGRERAFIRRKGRGATLRTPDDGTPVDEADLLPFLGGVDEALFQTMFGIGYAGLVAGGEEIIRGGGDVGQILFSAGSGIADLRQVQGELTAEAEALFLPMGQKPAVNAAIRAYRNTKRELADAELPGGTWARHDQALREARAGKERAVAETAALEAERSRLERISQALPLAARHKELAAEHEEYRSAPLLPPEFGERRIKADEAVKVAESLAAQSEADLAEIRKAEEGVNPPARLLSNAGTVEAFYQELGSHRKAAGDRIKLTGLLTGLRGEVGEILRSIRPGLDPARVEALRPARDRIIKIRELGDAHERLAARAEGAGEETARIEKEVDRLRRRIEKTPPPADPSRLKAVAEKIRGQGDLEGLLSEERREIRRLERDLRTGLADLRPWAGGAEELADLEIPAPEAIDAFEARFTDLGARVDRRQEALSDAERDLEEIRADLRGITGAGEIPTEAALDAARALRDRGWRLIRRMAEGGGVAEEEGREFTDRVDGAADPSDLPAAYERTVALADGLADRLWREADRVARHTALTAEAEKLVHRRERCREALAASERALADLREEWDRVWASTGVPPGTPREMRAWAARRKEAAALGTAVAQRRTAAADLEDRIRSARKTLIDALNEADPPEPDGDAPLADLLAQAGRAVHRLDAAAADRRRMTEELSARATELRDARARAEKADADLDRWRRRWAPAVAPLGLDGEATPAQAGALVEEIKTLFAKIREAEILEKRIEGIDQDAARFAEQVDRFAQRHAPDLAGRPAGEIVSELHGRLGRAREDQTRRRALAKQAEKEAAALREARRRGAEARAQLTAMCREAGCDDPGDLPRAEERAARRAALEAEMAGVADDLRALAGGATLEAFLDDVKAADPDAIPPRIAELTAELETLAQRRSDLDQTIGSETAELARMDGSDRAARLAEEAQSILAGLESHAERYIRLRLASAVLARAIDRYRERHQGPILGRATALFRRMTLGAFDGLRLEFDQKGGGVLVGVRSGGGEIVPVEGMSEGTVDQLYLAVRLASLETYLGKNEPMPFIVDDILIKFDDPRSAATLEVLAELSGRTQVIFFTHHRHLLDLARNQVDPDRLFIHTLGDAGP